MSILQNENAGQIKELKRKRKSAKNKAKALSKRVSQIDKIRTKAMNDFCGYAGVVNKYINRCGTNLASGLKGTSTVTTTVNDIDDERETTAAPIEYYINSAIDSMTREINNNSSDMRSYNNQVYSYESQIKELGGTIMPWE